MSTTVVVKYPNSLLMMGISHWMSGMATVNVTEDWIQAMNGGYMYSIYALQ